MHRLAALFVVIVSATTAPLAAKDWAGVARRRPPGGLDGYRRPRQVPRGRTDPRLARADRGRLRGPLRGGRPRLRDRRPARGPAQHGGGRAPARPRRGNRRRPLDPRVGHQLRRAAAHLRDRPARHADRGRRPRLRRRRHGQPAGAARGGRQRAVADGLRPRLQRRHPLVGHLGRAARGRRPAHQSRRRRARRQGRRLRQADRRGPLAGALLRLGAGLHGADPDRRGRHPAAHRLAPARDQLARPPRPAPSTGRSPTSSTWA